MSAPPPPMALVAELTHRCPLACPYCSNPLALARGSAELGGDEWRRVFDEAAALGVLQLHLTGGEPMARRDLLPLAAHAAEAGLYVNLITSGVLLGAAEAAALAAAGVAHVQISFQDSRAAENDAGGDFRGGFARKLAAAAAVRGAGMALTANFVVHRGNAGRAGEMIALGRTMGAGRVEIAHVQYHGWALRNRAALLPSRDQVAAVSAAVAAAGAGCPIDYVLPDYYAERPKACMGGWGRTTIVVTPEGRILPCHAAAALPLDFSSVREGTLADAWTGAPFARFRGTAWMPEPCRGCPERERDWGGCRCQAFALVGDMGATDPACALAPGHLAVPGWEAAGAALAWRRL